MLPECRRKKKSKQRWWWRGRLAHWAMGTSRLFSLSLHQLWRNPNRQRRLRTIDYIHLLLCLIFPSPSLPNWNEHKPHCRLLLLNIASLSTGSTLHPDCFSKVKPTQTVQHKDLWGRGFSGGFDGDHSRVWINEVTVFSVTPHKLISACAVSLLHLYYNKHLGRNSSSYTRNVKRLQTGSCQQKRSFSLMV